MNLKLQSAVFILCCLVSQFELNNAQQACSFEQNTNFYGNDIAYVYASCASSCCSQCKSRPGCTGWTVSILFFYCIFSLT